MRTRNRLPIVIALILLSWVSVCAPAKEKNVGVWKPTSMVGPDAPQRVAVCPDGSIWTLYGPPDGGAPWSLARSANGGTTWTTVLANSVDVGPPITLGNIDLFVVDSENCAWVYTLSDGLSRFSPAGDLLTTTGLGFSLSQMVFSPDGYLYRLSSADEGLDRVSWNGQVRTTPFHGDMIRDITADSKGTLFAVGGDVHRSRDGGLNWETVLQGNIETPFYYISVTRDDTIYIPYYFFKRSTDGGQTWESLALHGWGLMGLPDGSIAASFDAIISGGTFGSLLYRSWDRGNTWTEFMPGIVKEDYLYGGVVGTYGDQTVYASFSFVESKSSQNGLYRMLLPQRAGADKAWPKY